MTTVVKNNHCWLSSLCIDLGLYRSYTPGEVSLMDVTTMQRIRSHVWLGIGRPQQLRKLHEQFHSAYYLFHNPNVRVSEAIDDYRVALLSSKLLFSWGCVEFPTQYSSCLFLNSYELNANCPRVDVSQTETTCESFLVLTILLTTLKPSIGCPWGKGRC